MTRYRACLAVAFLAACGSSSSTTDGPPAADASASTPDARAGTPDAATADALLASNASIMLSGDQTGTFAAVASGGSDSGDGKSVVAVIVASLPAGFSAITITAELNGVLSAKDYLPADFVSGDATVMAAGNKNYSAQTGSTGTFSTLHLTSVELLGQEGTTTVYTIHGSIQATLPAFPSGNDVTLSATF